MSSYEVPEPIINSPFDEPKQHWHIEEGKDPELRPGRRPAMYFYRDPKAKPERSEQGNVGIAIELKLVNRIRERARQSGYSDSLLEMACQKVAAARSQQGSRDLPRE
jgi:type III restriction enzyme